MILLNMAPSQKLVSAPGAIFRGNTVSNVDMNQKYNVCDVVNYRGYSF